MEMRHLTQTEHVTLALQLSFCTFLIRIINVISTDGIGIVNQIL
jgi:uncharacterized membrane protein